MAEADSQFARLFRDLRRERRLSLRRLARRLHYSHSYLWHIETGRKPPPRKLGGGAGLPIRESPLPAP